MTNIYIVNFMVHFKCNVNIDLTNTFLNLIYRIQGTNISSYIDGCVYFITISQEVVNDKDVTFNYFFVRNYYHNKIIFSMIYESNHQPR